ncbi:uncharacterized protein BDW43DRAFT_307704 [Aspergillus alliaceus]|uniref:uncharacterized protein n=1 Tax=Petromyces alliaceus TaxID=209559 RepID=UPI0012A565DD|nr:uncharacterized protein BDW43DRAFT_307704 [Aspergillus alliaceus]KAB8237429.1 hypothetical protein BDW43DRAFT_307704 [Aspergillus alliaceus]
MRLRESIRPPERYESEHLYTPLVQRPLRQCRNAILPPYIDFNQSLPPAAFPTINFPRPPVPGADNSVQGQQIAHSTCSHQRRDQSRHHGEIKDNREARVDLEDIPINQIDNYIASNGDLNPVYVKNMATMAIAGSSSTDNDITPEEADDIEHHHEPVHSIPEPKWTDLCPGIQVEIFDNLLNFYRWNAACHKLGLSLQEQHDLEEHISARNEQLEREDSQLESMRRKHLRALLKIDNSLRHSYDSHQFVFCKISQKATGRLQRSTKPDYLLCHASEVANARRYLYQHGMDPKYAGDWGSCFITPQASGDERDPEMSGLKSQLNRGQYMELKTGTTDGYMDLSAKERAHSIPNKQIFINTIGAASIANPTDLKLRTGNLNTAPRWLNLLYDQSIHGYQPAFQENKLVRLKIGVKRAAQIRDDKPITCIQPVKLVKCFPPIDAVYYDPPSWSSGITQNTTERYNPLIPQRPRSTSNSAPQPLPRTMGNWPYDPVEPQPTTSSMRFQQRLEEARQETERTERPGAQHPAECRGYGPFSTPIQSLETTSWSSSTFSGRIISPSSSGELYGASVLNQGARSSTTATSVETSSYGSTRGIPGPEIVYSPNAPSNSSPTWPDVANIVQTNGERAAQQGEYGICPLNDEMVLPSAGRANC